MRNKYVVIGATLAVLIPAAVLAWWLLSPLFVNQMVDEELPFTTTAQIPEGMTRQEAEMVMAGMAKINQEVDEAMPDSVLGDEASGAPAALKQGNFRDGDSFHRGSGQATIYQGPQGSHVLRLENFNVTNGPDLHVILTSSPNPQSRAEVNAAGHVDLGSLKGNLGNQNYEIPDGVDIDNVGSVVIYCQPFHVIFSVASLENLG